MHIYIREDTYINKYQHTNTQISLNCWFLSLFECSKLVKSTYYYSTFQYQISLIIITWDISWHKNKGLYPRKYCAMVQPKITNFPGGNSYSTTVSIKWYFKTINDIYYKTYKHFPFLTLFNCFMIIQLKLLTGCSSSFLVTI